jgi:hypothetical protein
VAQGQKPPPSDIPPEVIEHARQSYEDAKFRARLWGMLVRAFKAFAAFVLTTSATIVVLQNSWEGLKRWLGSVVR